MLSYKIKMNRNRKRGCVKMTAIKKRIQIHVRISSFSGGTERPSGPALAETY